MSDRIIRAADVRQLRAWSPQQLEDAAGFSSGILARANDRSGHSAPIGDAAIRQPASVAGANDLPRSAAQLEALLERVAAEAFARGQQAARDEGNAAAYEAGLADGQAQARAALQSDAAAQLDDLIAQLEAAWQQAHQASESIQMALPVWVTDMSLALARQVIGDVRNLDAKLVSRRLENAMSGLSDAVRASVQIVMHPRTQALFEEAGIELGTALRERFKTDDSLAPGGFAIRTSAGEIDESLESRWRRAVETFCTDAAQKRLA